MARRAGSLARHDREAGGGARLGGLPPLLVLLVALALAAVSQAAAPTRAQASVDKLDRSNWPSICVNRRHRLGQRYRPTRLESANCRIVRRVGADRRSRRFVVSVPRRALRRARTPVVYFFHGTSGTGEQYWKISRWRELAHRHGFVAVFPSALGYDLNSNQAPNLVTVWNAIGQRCDLVDPRLMADDVAFVRRIHADLSRQLRLDRRRIYAAGFSNGGEFVHRIAAEAGDIFAAAASWAGIPAEDCAQEPLVPSPNPIPIWNGMGSRDDRYLFGVEELPLDSAGIEAYGRPMFAAASRLYSVSATNSRELALDDFISPPAVPGYSPVWSPVLEHAAVTPGATNTYHFVVLDELGHKYPNAWPGQSRQTAESQGISMALLQLQYFRARPKPMP